MEAWNQNKRNLGRSKRFVRTINYSLLQAKMNKKPKRCCYPNCFECPYTDCRYDRLEVEDYTESNNRDYILHEADTGKKLHHQSDKEYRNARITAYQRRNRRYVDRHEYNQRYYAEHGDEIKQKMRDSYDTKKNTKKCRKYRKANRDKVDSYQKSYYLLHREEKLRKARERYQERKMQCE